MKATKWTIALVALLLALACVFAACGKKDEPAKTDDKPADTTPAPVDDKPADTTPTVSREELNAIAENLKVEYAKEFLDLYTADTKTLIEGELAEAILNIQAAASKKDAEALAADFIEALKGKQTIADAVKEILANLGEITLADEDAINEAREYDAKLNSTYYGKNELKKNILNAYRADTETQKAITAAWTRLITLKAAKADADTALTGENAEIASLLAEFKKDGKVFDLATAQALQKVNEDIAAWAKLYDIEIGSAAYNEIIAADALAQATKAHEDGIKDKADVVNALNLIKTYNDLAAKAESLRYKVYCFIDKTDTAVPPTEYATKAAAIAAGVKEENVIEAETNATSTTADYKLVLKADLEAAENAYILWRTTTSESVKTTIGYYDTTVNLGTYNTAAPLPAVTVKKVVGDPAAFSGVAPANSIYGLKASYTASAVRAAIAFNGSFGALDTTLYVDGDIAKDDTTATWTGFTSDPKKTTYLTNLTGEIKTLKATFKTLDTDGTTKIAYTGALLGGDYTVTDGVNSYKVVLVNGAPAVTYTAWTYAYQFKTAGDLTPATTTKLDVVKLVNTAANVTNANNALNFLTKYVGEGEYADSYDFDVYKTYAPAFAGKSLSMKDQTIKEVATAQVVEINGKDVNVAKSAALETKVLSLYTVATAISNEDKRIADAKDAATKALQDAALALRDAGDVNAVAEVKDLYDSLTDATTTTPNKLNKDLNGDDADATYNALYALPATVAVEVKPESKPGAGDNVVVRVYNAAPGSTSLIGDALKAAASAKALTAGAQVLAAELAQAALDVAQNDLDENAKLVAIYDEYIANAKAELDRVTAGKNASLLKDTDVTTADANYKKVAAIKDLLLNKKAFDAANTGSALVALVDTNSYDGTNLDTDTLANVAALGAVIDAFKGDIPAAKQNDLKVALSDIYTGDADAKNALTANVATKKTALETAVKACTGTADLTAPAAYAELAKINAAVADITAFAKNNNANYINLNAKYVFGDTAITVDYLTEVVKEKLLANVYDKIYSVIAYAKALDTKYAITPATATVQYILDTDTDPDGDGVATETWQAAAENRLKDYKVIEEAVTSIADADEQIKKFAVADAYYNFDDAVKLINQALVAAGQAPITRADLDKAL